MVQMALVFAFTFAMGLLLAYAYARSFSMLLPFAIHLGWNWMQNYVFPDNPMGSHVFVLDGPPPVVTISYLAFYNVVAAKDWGTDCRLYDCQEIFCLNVKTSKLLTRDNFMFSMNVFFIYIPKMTKTSLFSLTLLFLFCIDRSSWACSGYKNHYWG